MSDQWDDIGFVISSRYRVTVLGRLAEGPATPSRIAEDSGFAIAHVSRTLGKLRDRTLVRLLVPEDRKKGRVYGITERGRDVWEQIESQDMVEDEAHDQRSP